MNISMPTATLWALAEHWEVFGDVSAQKCAAELKKDLLAWDAIFQNVQDNFAKMKMSKEHCPICGFSPEQLRRTVVGVPVEVQDSK